jgi:hypothetical protein
MWLPGALLARTLTLTHALTHTLTLTHTHTHTHTAADPASVRVPCLPIAAVPPHAPHGLQGRAYCVHH